MRDCPTIVAKGRESKQISISAPMGDAPINKSFYELQQKDQNRMRMRAMMILVSSIYIFVI